MMILKRIEEFFTDLFITAGGMALLLFHCILDIRHFYSGARRILIQMIQVGWNTIPLASMIGLFTGMITAL